MKKQQLGYTLVELIVVVSIVVVMLVTAVALFYAVFIGGGKTASTEAVKQAGQYAMGQMTYLVRNARKLVDNGSGQTCASGMTALGIQNQDTGTTIFAAQTSNNFTRLASNSGVFLTPSNMNISTGPTFNCTDNGDGSPPTVQISFTLQKGVVGTDKARDIVTIPFVSQVTLRNY